MLQRCAAYSLTVLLFSSQWLWANQAIAPADLLQKMSRSQRELNYQGLFTYEQADEIQSMRISHALIDNEEYERLERLNSTHMDVVRKGHGPSCMHMGDKLIQLLKQQSNPQSDMAHFYDFTVVGHDRVAGRTVVELAVMPRDKHRFGHRLSLDEESGLLLRGVQYSIDNRVLERFQFVDINLDAQLDNAYFTTPRKHQQQVGHIPPVVQELQPHFWKLSWLPGGFKLSPKAANDTVVDSQTFTDGLAVFSVFVEDHDNENPAGGVQGHAQRGATMAYSRAFQLGGKSYRVTVVGEIPQTTAERIASSIVTAG